MKKAYSTSGMLLCCLVALSVFWTCLFQDRQGIYSQYPDAWEFIWTISRSKIELGHYYHTNLLFHPFGSSLHFHAMAEGVTLPFALIFQDTPPTVIFQYIVGTLFLLNFACAYLLFHKLSQSCFLAALFSFLLSFHPWMLARLDAGHLNFLCFFPVLCICLLILKVREEKKLFHQVMLGLALGYLAYVNLYYVYDVLLALAFLGVLSIKDWRTWRVFGLPLFLGGLLWIPKILPMYLHRQAFTPHHAPETHSADLLAYFLPNIYQYIGSYFSQATLLSNPVENALPLSLGALLLFCIACDLRKKENQKGFLLILFFLVLGLGPNLQVNGLVRFSPLPFQAFQYLPQFPSVPARFGWFGIFFLLLLLAKNVKLSQQTASHRAASRYATLALLLFMTIELFPKFPSLVRLPEYPALEKANSFASAYIDMGNFHAVMLRQSYHGKPSTGGYLSRRPKKVLSFYRKNAFLRYLEKGRMTDMQKITEDFKALQANCVILERHQVSFQNRLRDLSWFETHAGDERIDVFCAAI